jgi:hypothetical protein
MKFSANFCDRGVSRGQGGESPMVVNLSFLDRLYQPTDINSKSESPLQFSAKCCRLGTGESKWQQQPFGALRWVLFQPPAGMHFCSRDRKWQYGWSPGDSDPTIGHAQALAADRARPCGRNAEPVPLFGFRRRTSYSVDSNRAAFVTTTPVRIQWFSAYVNCNATISVTQFRENAGSTTVSVIL